MINMDKDDKDYPAVSEDLLPGDGTTKGSEETDNEEELEISCGISRFKPKALQKCADIRAYTAAMSGALLFNIAWIPYFMGVVRSVEKRFGLSSTEANLTLTITDFLATFLGLLAGYVGRTVHKPRLIGLGMSLMALGMLFYALPFFIYGSLEAEELRQFSLGNSSYNGYDLDLCDVTPGGPSEAVDECANEGGMFGVASQRKGALICMNLGGVFIGLGMPLLDNLGLPYIDENTKPGNSALFIGIATSMFAWAPIVGFLLAALCTKLTESISGTSSLSPSSPQWIGAWWFGFIIIGIFNLLSGLPMLLFPKHLEHYYVDNNKKKTKKKKASVTAAKIGTYIKDFPKIAWKLLSNARLITLLISKVLGIYVVTGIFMQQPRYLEIHFKQPAYLANIISAMVGAIVGSIGNVLGGYLMKRLKLGTVGSARLFVFSIAVGVLTILIALFLDCPQRNLAGQMDNNYKLDVDMSCNADCGCTRSKLEPVCVNNTINYISACHAGCHGFDKTNGTFHDCGCAPQAVTTITAGYCETEPCQKLIPYILVFLVGTFLGSLGGVPATIIMFRVVGKHDKAFASGIFAFAVNLLCFVPSPILYGRLFDSTCILWQQKCGQRGACLLYDTDKFRFNMHVTTLGFKLASLIFGLICLFLITRQEKKDKEKGTLGEGHDGVVKDQGI